MGCTPSKSTGFYTHDRICQDPETCSTFVPNLKSSVSAPEESQLRLETSGGNHTFLSGEIVVSWVTTVNKWVIENTTFCFNKIQPF